MRSVNVVNYVDTVTSIHPVILKKYIEAKGLLDWAKKKKNSVGASMFMWLEQLKRASQQIW